MAHGDRSVDVFIRKLRIKLEQRSPNWAYIHTHFGIGYRFDPEPLDATAADPPAGQPPAASGSAPDPAATELEPAERVALWKRGSSGFKRARAVPASVHGTLFTARAQTRNKLARIDWDSASHMSIEQGANLQ